MTAVSTPLGTSTAHKRATITPSRLAMDVWLLAERNLLKIWRRPRLIVFSIVQPIMQLILFAFVFGTMRTSATPASPTKTSSSPPSSCRRWCSPASSRASASPTTCTPG